MKIAPRVRSRNSQEHDVTGRATRSSSTPRSLRQTDISIRRTQATDLKRDIAGLKRQTKALKKRSPITARQAGPEIKGGTPRMPFMEANSSKGAIVENDFTLPSSTLDNDGTGLHGEAFAVTNNALGSVIKSEADFGSEARDGNTLVNLKSIADVNDEYDSGSDQAVENIGACNDRGDGSDDEEHIGLMTKNGGGKAKRRKRRRRFVPKKKPRVSAQEAERIGISFKTRSTMLSMEKSEAIIERDKSLDLTSKEDSTSKWIIKELQASKGFVDKVEVDFEPEKVAPMRRTPRMASLNAIAKVNAVLHSYSPMAGKSTHEIRDRSSCNNSEYGPRPKADRRRHRRSTSSVTQTDDIVFFTSIKGEQNEWTMSGSGDVFQQSVAEHQPISDSSVSSTSNWTTEEEGTMTKDKAVQTMFNHKAVQTDVNLMDGVTFHNSSSGCTCGFLENVNSQESLSPSQGTDNASWTPPCTVYHIPPTINTNSISVPLCSCISTKTTTHTIAIPFTKTHMLTHTDAKHFDANPILSAHSSKRMASLNALAMMNAMKVLDRPLFAYAHGSAASSRRDDLEKSDKRNCGQIRIPKISFQATSTSKFSVGTKGRLSNAVKSSHMKSLSNQIEHLIETKRQPFRSSNKVSCYFLSSGVAFYSKSDTICTVLCAIICREWKPIPSRESRLQIKKFVIIVNGEFIKSFHLHCIEL